MPFFYNFFAVYKNFATLRVRADFLIQHHKIARLCVFEFIFRIIPFKSAEKFVIA